MHTVHVERSTSRRRLPEWPMSGPHGGPNFETMTASDLSNTFADIVRRSARSIVRIEGRDHGLTGVVIANDRIVTSSRALRRDTDLRVTWDERTFAAQVVGRDPSTDVALLSFDASAPGQELGAPESLHGPSGPEWRSTDDLRVGELALAVARPGQSVRAALGILGVVGGSFTTEGGTVIERYLELDRDLPRGFAGSLLVDSEGRGIGVNLPGVLRSATVTLPSQTLVRVVAQLEQHGHVPRGYLGVGVFPAHLPNDIARHVGQERAVAVVSLEEDGPAAKAGLVIGDLLLTLDGEPVTSPLSLRSTLLDRSGETLTLEILRAGVGQEVQVAVGARA